jgi:hypothetical protein
VSGEIAVERATNREAGPCHGCIDRDVTIGGQQYKVRVVVVQDQRLVLCGYCFAKLLMAMKKAMPKHELEGYE